MESYKFTVDEVFDEINKLNSEEKVALSNNISLISTHLLMNDLEQYRKTLKTIDDTMDSLTKTKSALLKLKSNITIVRYQKLIEKAKSFLSPENAIVVANVKANEFARMANVISDIAKMPVDDCARKIYDILIHISHIKNYQNRHEGEELADDMSLLEVFNVDLNKSTYELLNELYSRWENYNSAQHVGVARLLGGISYEYFVLGLMGNWEKVLEPITTKQTVEVIYSLKETTEAMDQYFA